MNIDFNIFTEKFAFAVQEAQNLARRHGQEVIDVCHLLLALVQYGGGIVPSLLSDHKST
ncbi:MAG: ATP-dependent Clp protease ATP-binding subunit ClpB [Lentimonas sp.]